MRPTIVDIARAAAVSTATVDRVLNERPGVHARTRRRVLAVAQGLGYLAPPGADAGVAAPVSLDFIIPGGTNTFFDLLAAHLQEIAQRRAAEASIRVLRMAAFAPEALAEGLRDLARSADGIGLIALDHPAVRTAIREAVAGGVRMLTLVSDIVDVPRHFYVGIDNRAAGRLAGYLLGRFLQGRQLPVEAKAAMFAGSMNYRGHEERANGCRRILAEAFPGIVLLETTEMHDDVEESYREAAALLARTPDLAGIYNVGAGNRGIVRALEEAGRGQDVVFIGHELTQYTRRFLLAGSMDAVIDQAPRRQAELAVERLLGAARGHGEAAGHEPPLRAQAFFRENLPEA